LLGKSVMVMGMFAPSSNQKTYTRLDASNSLAQRARSAGYHGRRLAPISGSAPLANVEKALINGPFVLYFA
jgi:hypothetical protein